jgi:hypothetical protein
MSKQPEKIQSTEKIETVDDLDEVIEPSPEPVKQPAFAGKKVVRNLTNESIVATLSACKAAEVAKIGEDEVVEAALPVFKDGKPQRDEQGFVKIEKRTVLKRDKVASDWDKKIAAMVKELG